VLAENRDEIDVAAVADGDKDVGTLVGEPSQRRELADIALQPGLEFETARASGQSL